VTDRARALLLVLAIVVAAVASDRLRASASGAHDAGQTYEDTYYLPPDEWLSVFSLGWDEALADLIWMRALIYYGDEMSHDGQVRFALRYGEAIEALDPEFVAVYRWVGIAGLYRPQAVPPEDMQAVVEFMERGARRHPDDGELIWDLGATLAFELAPVLEDQDAANQARERAVLFLTRASRLGSAPSWASLTNAALLTRIGRTSQAAAHLEEMYDQATDPATRERMRQRILQLRNREQAEAFLAAMDELERERTAAFPYATPSMYLLLGDRPVVDIDAPIREGLPAALADAPPP